MPKLILAVSAVALFAGSAMAQTINNAPQNSPPGVQDQVKQAPQVGDPSQVGGTPSANTKGAQGQMQTLTRPAQWLRQQRANNTQVNLFV
jgi:hypothetical protein